MIDAIASCRVVSIEQRTEPVLCVRCVAAASRGAGCPSPNYWSWRRQPDRLTKRQGQKWYCLAIPTVPFRGFALLPPKHNPLLLYYGCSLQRSNVLLGRCIKTTHSSLKAKKKSDPRCQSPTHTKPGQDRKRTSCHTHIFLRLQRSGLEYTICMCKVAYILAHHITLGCVLVCSMR